MVLFMALKFVAQIRSSGCLLPLMELGTASLSSGSWPQATEDTVRIGNGCISVVTDAPLFFFFIFGTLQTAELDSLPRPAPGGLGVWLTQGQLTYTCVSYM